MTEQARDHTRDPGYYWIQGPDEAEVAYWDGSGWAFVGCDHSDVVPVVLSEVPLVFTHRDAAPPREA
jgi:hypothetical protein